MRWSSGSWYSTWWTGAKGGKGLGSGAWWVIGWRWWIRWSRGNDAHCLLLNISKIQVDL